MVSRSRRAILGSIGGLAFGAGLSRASDGAFVLLDDSFEDGEPGSFPNAWIKRGNETQSIVQDDNAVGGDHVLFMKGKAAGCLEATADRRLPLSGATKFTISVHVFPSTRGTPGCHEHRALVALWPEGNPTIGSILAAFRTDGRLFCHGRDLGSYQPNRWHKLDITYDRTGPNIRATYRLNGEHRGEVSWRRPEYEPDLTYLRLASGDFSAWWDEIRVVQLAGAEPTVTDKSANTGDDFPAIGLGIIGGGVGLGLYLFYKHLSDTENDSDNETRMYDPDED